MSTATVTVQERPVATQQEIDSDPTSELADFPT